MPQRKEIRWSQLKVGLVSLASIVLLAIVIFLITGETGFFAETMTIRTYSPDAGGLRTGATVRLAGVDVGIVRQVALSGRPNPSEAVEIIMEVNRKFESNLRADSRIILAAEGLLGDRYINISKGSPDAAPIPSGGVVPFRETPEFSELVGGSRDLVDNLNVLTSRLNTIVGTIESGQGTVGKLIQDDTLYQRLNATVNNADKLVTDITSGRGSIGRLLVSEDFYEHVNTTVTKLEGIADRVESGEGTLGKLVHDPTLYQNAQEMVSRGSLLLGNINNGQGTLGKLANDEELYRKLDTSIGKLDEVLTGIRAGEGSMGRLFQDPTLYNNLNSTSVEVRELLADFRKDPKKFLTIQFRIF
ncbi:MAG: MCE family protein [Acidobacteria bacterium]|nr:MCE family protein [Acidobacteriota bacterium]